jgi:hypothetical protein
MYLTISPGRSLTEDLAMFALARRGLTGSVVVRDSTDENEEFHSHPTALTGYVIDGTLSIQLADGSTVLYRPGASIDVGAKVFHRCLAGPGVRLVVAVAGGSSPASFFGATGGSDDSACSICDHRRLASELPHVRAGSGDAWRNTYP